MNIRNGSSLGLRAGCVYACDRASALLGVVNRREGGISALTRDEEGAEHEGGCRAHSGRAGGDLARRG